MDLPELSLIFLISIIVGGLSYWLVLRVIRSQSDRISMWRWAISPRWADALVVVLVSAYALIFGTLSIRSYFAYSNGGMDLGIFDQAVWNSLRGRLLETSIPPDARVLIGARFSPILLAFVPLYTVWSSSLVLLIIQTLGIALGAFPIYWWARRQIGCPMSLIVVTSYLLFPALQYVNLFEFHEISLSVPLLAFATFFLLRQKYIPFLVCLGLVLLVKEEMAFVVSAFGLYVLLIQRKRWLGIGLVLFGAFWAVLLLEYVLPFFRGAEGYYFFSHGMTGGAYERYGYLGKSLPEIVTTLVTRPFYVLEHVFIVPKIEFVLLLLVPLALTSLFSPEIMILTLPTFGIILLCDLYLIYSIRYHYTASLLPFLFFAAIVGIQRIWRWRNYSEIDRHARGVALGALLLTASILSYYFQSPGPLARNFDPARYEVNTHTAIGQALFQSIPAEAIVLVQTGLIPHVTDRRSVYEFPAIPFFWQAEYLVADTTQPWYQRFKGTWENVLASGYFQVVTQPDGYLLARRLAQPQMLQVKFEDQVVLRRVAVVTRQTVRGGEQIYVPVEWFAQQDVRKRYVVQTRLVDDQDHVWARDDRDPCWGSCPTQRWNFGQFVDDQYALGIPSTTPSGEYKITMSLYDPASDDYASAHDAAGKPLSEVVVGIVRVEKDKSSVTASQLQIEQPLFVDMGELRFIGYVPPREKITPGELLQVGVYWRAREKPRGDYVVAVQLRDAAGRVAFERSARPANGAYPTTQWDAGEVLLDWHDFDLPRDLAIGSYGIFAVLRDAATGTRLGETLISTISVVK